MTRLKPVFKTCAECGAEFTTSVATQHRVTCSTKCQRDRRLRSAREYARRKYTPAAPHVEKPCEECGKAFIPYRFATRFCSRTCQEQRRLRRRTQALNADRKCIRCGATVPRQPGIPVCSDCKVDKRSRKGYERLRTLRRYSLTPELYEAQLVAQNNRCGICESTEWGAKGPNIDHDHATGEFRWLLCLDCNLGIGHFRDDPELLRRAAQKLEERSALLLKEVC